MRKSFILHKDSLAVVKELTKDQKADFLDAIVDYQNGDEVKLTGLMKAVFLPFKNQFDRDNDRFLNEVKISSDKGKLGNLKRWHNDLYEQVIDNQLDIEEAISIAKHRPPTVSDKPNRQASPKSLKNDSKNDNDNINNNYQYNNFVLDFQKIVGKQMRGNEKTQKMFSARLKEGFTQEQFCRAITNCKNDKWHIENPQYLTIEFILRNDKLEKYLNIVPEQTKPTGLTLEQAQARMRGELI
jgi:uncharacterized phage protein (TIGR02220 family)